MVPATKVHLKYLFHVQYYDGDGFIQNEEDVSRVDPTKSAYYDVEQDKVEYFTLITSDEGQVGVNLGTGIFLSTFEGFYAHNFTVGDPGPKPYKLIFYRQHTHNFTMGLEEIDHTIKYCIGYIDANGVEHKILVD